MFRKFAVALAVTLPLAAQVTETAAVTRVDVVVIDATGGRVRGLSAADFEITENGQRLPVAEFAEYSLDAPAGPAPASTDTRYVPLTASAVPTPPRRVVVLFDANATAADREAAQALVRRGDIVTMDGPIPPGHFASRVATATAQLARHPERKAIIAFGETTPQMATFASRRGVAFYDRNQLADAALDLGGYYSLSVRAANPRAIQVATTRPYNLRAVVSAPGTEIEDAVLAHHVAEPETNDLRISVSAEPTVTVADRRQVRLHILIPIRNLTLRREGDEVTGGFDVYVSAGSGGTIAPVNKQTHAIKWPAAALEKAGNRNMEFVVDVVVGPGLSRISVGVIDHRSKKTGFQRIEVTG